METLAALWQELMAAAVGLIMYFGMWVSQLDRKTKILYGLSGLGVALLLLRLIAG